MICVWYDNRCEPFGCSSVLVCCLEEAASAWARLTLRSSCRTTKANTACIFHICMSFPWPHERYDRYSHNFNCSQASPPPAMRTLTCQAACTRRHAACNQQMRTHQSTTIQAEEPCHKFDSKWSVLSTFSALPPCRWVHQERVPRVIVVQKQWCTLLIISLVDSSFPDLGFTTPPYPIP